MNYKLNHELDHNSNQPLFDLLIARGIDDPETYLYFSDQKKVSQAITDWRDLNEIDEAIPVFHDAIVNNADIALIVDCDVDGFMSSALIYSYIKKINPDAKITYYLHTGKAHGIDDEIMESLIENPPDLLIIPDAGSNEMEKNKILSECGVRILIIDHHLTDEPHNPYAIRVNNQISEGHVNKCLCGTGVSYYFCLAHDAVYGLNYAKDFLDLVAVATIADVMDLRSLENRIIVDVGLHNIKNQTIKQFIADNAYSMQNRTIPFPADIAFYIGPSINAVIRVGTQEQKKSVFYGLINPNDLVQSTESGAKLGEKEIAKKQAVRICRNAKQRQKNLVDKAMDKLEAKIFKRDLLENQILLIPVEDGDNIPPEITGLIATKISSKYHHPTLIVRESSTEEMMKGSGRIENNSALNSFKQYLNEIEKNSFAEGHDSAFGFGIKKDQVENFIDKTNEDLKDINFDSKYYRADYVFNADESSLPHVIYAMRQGERIWGHGVDEPNVIVEGITIHQSDIKYMKRNSLKFSYNNVTYTILVNPQAYSEFQLYDEMEITVYGKMKVNEWCGRFTPEILVDDYEIKGA